MSRQINRPINVATTIENGQLRPVSFMWRRSRYVIQAVLDSWLEAGRWWEQEPETAVWRVELVGGGVMEIACRGQEWRLMVIYD